MYSSRPVTRHARLTATLLLAIGLTGCYSDGTEPTTDTDSVAGTVTSVFDENGVNQTFNDEFWAALAQSYQPFVPEPILGRAQAPEDFIIEGRWGELIEWPEIATGAANMPDGRIVTWSSTSAENFGGKSTFTHSSVFDPQTESFSDSDNLQHNNFCAGISMLPDGRPFTAGGGATITTTSVFDSTSNTWSLVDNMMLPRWYATSTTLPTGQVLTSLGTNAQPYPEVWTEGEGWNIRTNLSLQSILDDKSATSGQRFWFPALNVAPDGSLFHPGPTSEMFSLNLAEGNGFTSHGKRENGDPHRLYNTTVFYDIGKMLVAGGGKPALATAMTIDINSPSPVVSPTNSMNFPRSMQNSVVLPDGDVLVIGGNSSGVQFSDDGTQLIPELWNPDTGQWQNLAPHSVPRNYHSTAMLLKDARIASMGGGLCGGCATNQRNGQIFEPPYLFNEDGTRAAQPNIEGNDIIASAGDSITIDGSADITRFNMLRLVALTHHHSTDQRLIPLNFQTVGTGSYQLDIPANPNVVLPGYYWIFALDNQGVPSAGRTLRINVTEEVQQLILPNTDSVSYEYFEGGWNALPDFTALVPLDTGNLDNFLLTPAQSDNNFGFRYTAKIAVEQAGEYTFYTTSDDGSELFINGQRVVDNDGLHPAEERNGKIQLTEGEHDIVVTFFEKTGGQTLSVSWAGPDFNKQNIASGLVGILPEPIDPSTDPIDPVVDPVIDPIVDPVIDPVVDPVIDPVVDPVIDPSDTNFITNSSFEDNANDWAACSSDATIAITDDSFEGNNALLVAGCAYDEFPVVAGTRYKLQCYAKSDGTAFSSMTLSFNDLIYNELEAQSVGITQPGYTVYTIDLTAPANSASGAVTLYSETNGAQFDNCAVLVIAADTPSVDPTIDPGTPAVDPITPVEPIDPVQGNLIANSTFEQDASDWAACSDDANIELTDDSFTGSGALSVSGCAYDEFPVIPNQSYTLTCDAKAGTASFSSLTLTYSDISYTELDSSTRVLAQTSYDNYQIDLTAPANSAFAAVTLYGEEGNAQFDDCIVVTRPGTNPTDPAPEPEPEPEPEPVLAGNNLLSNGDFENDLSGWTECQTGSTLQTSTDAATGDAAFAVSGCAFTEFEVVPGKIYQLSCSANANNSDFANMTLSFIDSSFTTLSSVDQTVNTSIAYGTITVEETAPATSATGVVDLYAEGNASALFDNCQVVEVDSTQ